jgi:hypothetical protein
VFFDCGFGIADLNIGSRSIQNPKSEIPNRGALTACGLPQFARLAALSRKTFGHALRLKKTGVIGGGILDLTTAFLQDWRRFTTINLQ